MPRGLSFAQFQQGLLRAQIEPVYLLDGEEIFVREEAIRLLGQAGLPGGAAAVRGRAGRGGSRSARRGASEADERRWRAATDRARGPVPSRRRAACRGCLSSRGSDSARRAGGGRAGGPRPAALRRGSAPSPRGAG